MKRRKCYATEAIRKENKARARVLALAGDKPENPLAGLVAGDDPYSAKPLDAYKLVSSLRSVVCPFCGNEKKSGQTLCYRDYKRLTSRMKHALYDRLGDGYEEAVAGAMQTLKINLFIMPSSPNGGDEDTTR